MSASVRQTSFLGGELAPLYWGRTDLPAYGRGARTLRNFFISKEGAAVSRPGTEYLAAAKGGGSASGRVRLLPFNYSDELGYVLEFGNNYIRFYLDGVQLTGVTLPYDTQANNFTVGQTITGLTSGATARIVGDTDAGATGTLQLDSVTGTFQNNEVLSESFDGEYLAFDAQVANFAINELVTGGTSGATGRVISQVDAGATGVLRLVQVVGTFVNNEALTGSVAGVATANLERALVNGSPSTVAYEISTPYGYADLSKLQWAQTGDIITLTHPGYAPRELRRYAQTYWTLSSVLFSPPTPYFTNLATNAAVFGPIAFGALPTETVASGLTAREWTWKVTAVLQEIATGVTLESAAATLTQQINGGVLSAMPATIPVYPEKPVTVGFQAITAATVPTPPAGHLKYRTIAYNWYRGSADLYGFVGTTKELTFVDLGDEPDYSVQPPRGQNPFEVRNAVGTLLRTENPAAVGFFQERRCFGGSWEVSLGAFPRRSETVFTSESGDYFNFDERVLSHVETEALVYALAARYRLEIRSFVARSHLIILGNSSVWTMAGAGGAPLGPASIDARLIDEAGANYMPGLVVGDAVLYARAKGNGVRVLTFQNERGGYSGGDLSGLSGHLFIGDDAELLEWCYQEDPWGVVWAVRSDGSLLSLTLAGDAYGWARHDTDGTVESVCACPEGDRDAVYLSVVRNINGSDVRYIERMTTRRQAGSLDTLGDVDDDVVVDCAIPFTGVAASTSVITGLTALQGESVYVIGKDNAVQGPYTVASGQVTLDATPTANSGSNVKLWVGKAFTADLETLDVASADSRTKQKQVTRLGIEVTATKGLKAGPDEDHLTPAMLRTVEDSYAAVGYATEVVDHPVLGGYGLGARCFIRQELPIPLTVVGITREVDVGG